MNILNAIFMLKIKYFYLIFIYLVFSLLNLAPVICSIRVKSQYYL